MTMMMQAVPYLGETGSLALGLIGMLTVAALILTVAQKGKAVFGRTPPFHEELDQRDKALRKMIFATEASLKERIAEQGRLTMELAEQLRDLQLDRQRKWEELRQGYSELRESLAFIRGKFEKAKN